MARPRVKGEGDQMSFRFHEGTRKLVTKLALRKKQTITDYIERYILDEAERLGITADEDKV